MQSFGTSCIKLAFENKGYEWDSINLFGIRKVKAGESSSNSFEDAIGCAYYDMRISRWEYLQLEGTTVAGLYYASHQGYTEGTAILKEGFYPNCYAIGLYRNLYEAFIQVEPMDYYKVGCKDGTLDTTSELKTGIIEANIHLVHNAQSFRNLGAYSSASQLVSTPNEFQHLVSICKYFALVGNRTRFSFALLTHDDVVEAFHALRQPSQPNQPSPKPKDKIIGDNP